MKITRDSFGVLGDGGAVDLFTLTNAQGTEAKITNYGCIVVSLRTPDRNGKFGDVVLGFDTLAEYVDHNPFFGCVAGRYANRIAQGRFTLDGVTYQLARNNGSNHLHGGLRGFDKVLWRVTAADDIVLRFVYTSADGEENYPGNLTAEVTYQLNDRNQLSIDYRATTDKPTIINLTNHTYFNLAGHGDILGHELMLNASYITPVDERLIPTGDLLRVDGTPFDFRQPTPIGARIEDDHEQIRFGQGYDHNYVFHQPLGGLMLAANVFEPTSGRSMELYTTQPGVQFYTGNFLTGVPGKGGRVYHKRFGFCLETQHFPDSPNQPSFPSTVLRPGERYTEQTLFQFGVRV
jgi:aldose 1-epimerase